MYFFDQDRLKDTQSIAYVGVYSQCLQYLEYATFPIYVLELVTHIFLTFHTFRVAIILL